MKIYTWDDMAEEQLNPLAGRKALHGTAITVAHFRFDKGNKVALHHHANDQITIVEEGAVRMVVGDEEFVLKAGQMVHVPPDIPHGNEALEFLPAPEVGLVGRTPWSARPLRTLLVRCKWRLRRGCLPSQPKANATSMAARLMARVTTLSWPPVYRSEISHGPWHSGSITIRSMASSRMGWRLPLA
jgi:hypothetical protein